MAVIDWPSNLVPGPGSGFGQRRYDLTFASDATGAQQDRVLGPPRWQLAVVQPDLLLPVQAGRWQALLMQLRGRVNHLQAWDFGRPYPQGTARGTLTLGANAAAGATSVVIAGCRGANLLLAANALDSAAWTGTAQVTPNTFTGPLGGSVADTITDNSAVSLLSRLQTVSVPNDHATDTASVYVRKTSGGTSATFALQFSFVGGSVVANNNPRLNTDTGVAPPGSPGIGVVADAGDWWRLSSTLANNGSGHTQAQVTVSPAIALHGAGAADVSATGSAVVAQVQLERNTSVATAPAAPTLLRGDLLQVGTGLGTQQVVMVTADATADDLGAMTVSVEPPLRVAHSSGATVVWDRPKAFFKLNGASTQWTYQAAQQPLVGGIALDFLESWS